MDVFKNRILIKKAKNLRFLQKLLACLLTSSLSYFPTVEALDWNVTSGDWAVGTNWTPPGPPTIVDQARINNSGTSFVTTPSDVVFDLIIGSSGGTGIGTLNIIPGGTLTSADVVELALIVNTMGTLNIRGPSALLNCGNALIVGNKGIGNFNITNGGAALTNGLNSAIGNLTNSVGTATVTDPGSLWSSSSPIVVGGSGIGTLNIQNQGTVSAPQIEINTSFGTGVLNISSLGLLQTGQIIGNSTNSTLNLNGGVIRATGNQAAFITQLAQATIQSGGAFIDSQGFTITIPQIFTGPGNLTKLGTGTLIMTGANTLTGNTAILQGTLQGNTASLPTGNALDNGVLIFDQASTGIFAGSISGSGAVVKENVGTLILTGSNSYTGGTLITGGTLQGDSNSLQGNILNNATLIFNQNFDGTYAGSMSGSGIFLKEGSATLQLTGNSGAFTGTSAVVSGNLRVNGILGGSLTVFNGATLSGTGFLGNVTNNGIIAPGNPLGPLHIANFVNSSTGIYLAEINGSGQSSEIITTGTAILNGGELIVTADPGIYLKGTTYTLIDAAGGLFGQFATTVLPPNLSLALTYLPNDLILTVLSSSFNTTGLKGNALRVAEYIRDFATLNDDFSKVIAALNTLNTAQLQKALSQLDPSLFEALSLTAGDTAHMINRTFTDRLDFLHYPYCNCCDSCGSCDCNTGSWIAGSADFIRQKRTGELRRFTTANEGISFGYDKRICDSLFAGVGAGYAHSNLHWGNSAGRSDINSFYLGIYAAKNGNGYYIDGSLLGFVDHYRVRRHIHFATIDRHAKNNHYGWGINPHLGAGLYWNFCTIDIIPFIDIDYYYIDQKKYHEHGAGSLNLHVRRNHSNLLRVESGLRFTRCYDFCGGKLRPDFSISYVAHRLMSGDKYRSSFDGIKETFAVFGTKHCFNQLELGAGIEYMLNDKVGITAWYDIELGRKRQEQEVDLEISYCF